MNRRKGIQVEGVKENHYIHTKQGSMELISNPSELSNEFNLVVPQRVCSPKSLSPRKKNVELKNTIPSLWSFVIH